jgi:hypothetical protein
LIQHKLSCTALGPTGRGHRFSTDLEPQPVHQGLHRLPWLVPDEDDEDE